MEQDYQWAIIGAGPAGIAALGKLLDNGVKASAILWLDPHFKVGDFGTLWFTVSSNTRVKFFNQFLLNVAAFEYEKLAHDCSLSRLNPEETCTLSHMVEPLQKITDHLTQQVTAVKTMVHAIDLSKRRWFLRTDDGIKQAKNVILATGALPSALNYPGVDVIPFDTAINTGKLSESINQDNTFAVFGSSHSAIIIIRSLVELGVKKIINFYQSPCRYALDMGDWILFDNTGLKGQTAAWAREHIDGVWPANLQRYPVSEEHITSYLPACDKVIYAVGFQARKNIIIGHTAEAQYNPRTGILAPGLFGLGIAYPELKTDPLGSEEFQVGLWKFMVYLNKVMPVWLRYSC